MEVSHPYTEELQILERRIRQCKAAQKINDMSAASLAVFDKLKVSVACLKNFFEEFPTTLRVKLVLVQGIIVLGQLEKTEISGEDDMAGQDQVKKLTESLVDVALPHLGQTAFNPEDPAVSGLLASCFTTLESKVQELVKVDGGNQKDQAWDVEVAMRDCEKALED